MADSWAIFGGDLHLEISRPRVRAAVESALRDAVQTGRLRPGSRLPSSPSLARDLSVARNTVAEAYGQLVAEGWLVARQGSGTRVAERPVSKNTRPLREVSAARPFRFDLRPGTPHLSAFPRSAWLGAMRRSLARAPYTALGYGDARGRPELLRALADTSLAPAVCESRQTASSCAQASRRDSRCCVRY